MDKKTLYIVGAGIAGYLLWTYRAKLGFGAPGPTQLGGSGTGLGATANVAATTRTNLAAAVTKTGTSRPSVSPAPPASPGANIGGRDLTSAGAGIGAAAGCTALGASAALAPLCGAAGSYLGGEAYDAVGDAYSKLKGYF